MIPPAIRRRYAQVQSQIEKVATRVREAVLRFCEQKGYAYTGRIKTVDSFAEKLETGRFAKWSDIDDTFACTVVIPTLEHEESVLEFLRTTFREFTLKKRGSTKKSPDVFRFDATRFIGRLNLPEDLPSVDDLRSVLFEVQIRSAFEHAWSVTTHALTYKSGTIDWKLRRLTAQMKAAVEQLDSLVLAFERSAEQITEHEWPELRAKQRLLVGLGDLFRADRLPREMEPTNWSRFVESIFSLLASSKGFQRTEAERAVDSGLEHIDTYLSAHSFTEIPLSLSLFQFLLAILTDSGALTFPLRGFNALITPEIVEFFPNTNAVVPAVDLDN